ncbi:hypothetical protein ACWC09_08685 [Streptomyces sp. NPDC001617]
MLLVPNLLDDPNGMVDPDGEPHQRLRGTVRRAFTPRAISRRRHWVASVVDALLDAYAGQKQPADIIEGFTR